MMAESRKDNIYMAKLAEQAERYDEMAEFMEKVAEMLTEDDKISNEERDLISVAYKNVIGARRASWRIVSSIEQKEESRGNDDHLAAIKEFRAKIESELTSICGRILKLLQYHLLPAAYFYETEVFFLKMKGDYYRYLAEFKTGSERKDAADITLFAYLHAQNLATDKLEAIHPFRLGLALNFSVFYYEILNDTDRACDLARQAFGDAMFEQEFLGEESYKDSTLILQLLQENLTLWTSDLQDDAIEEDYAIEEDDGIEEDYAIEEEAPKHEEDEN